MWHSGWLVCLLGGCVLLEPEPRDTGPRYVSRGNHSSSSRAGSGSSSAASAAGTSSSRGAPTSTVAPSSSAAAPSSSAAPACPDGAVGCLGTVKVTCDADGGQPVEDCHDQGLLCVPLLGCRTCNPGTGTCSGNQGTTCAPTGDAWLTSTCDPVQGQSCNPATGKCQGACVASALGRSYIGCDYFPTVTANTVAEDFHFAVAVSNTTGTRADITVTRGSTTVTTVQVAPNSVQVVQLPWELELKGPAQDVLYQTVNSVLVAQGAYRLRSTQPVTLYQFNPLEYMFDSNGSYSATNDASLLLPTSAWTNNYYVASLASEGDTEPYNSGFYAVTAQQDGTTVVVTPGPQAGRISTLPAGIDTYGRGQVTLQAGDVMEVFTLGDGTSDLTGTLVTSDKPVQVIAGHQCANIPVATCCCDHLEESMFPMETLAKQYLVTAPLVPTLGETPKDQLVRVVATVDGTTLAYDPPQPGAPTGIFFAGGWVELPYSNADFGISADHPILVVQYMEGQEAGGGTGDPAMAQAVGIRQYRSSYLFHAPSNYEANYVNIVARTGTVVNLDGTVVSASAFLRIGTTGFGVARVTLSNSGSGNHSAASASPFGISVYGYGQYTSYWYPGGGNLTDLLH